MRTVKVIFLSSGCLIVIVHSMPEENFRGITGHVIRPTDAVISLVGQISIPEEHKEEKQFVKQVILN